MEVWKYFKSIKYFTELKIAILAVIFQLLLFALLWNVSQVGKKSESPENTISLCRNESLPDGKYVIFPNKTLFSFIHNKTFENYTITGEKKTVVCVPAEKCESTILRKNEFNILRTEDLYSVILNESFTTFDVNDVTGEATICYPYAEEYSTCGRKGYYEPHEYEMFSNYTVKRSNPETWFNIGQYSKDKQAPGDVIMCMELSKDHHKKVDNVMESYSVFWIISCVCLFIVFVIYLVKSKLNHHTRVLLCHIGSLFLWFLLLSVHKYSLEEITSEWFCTIFGVILFWVMLTAFGWLNVMAYDLWRIFSGTSLGGSSSNRSNLHRCVLYSVYAWFGPTIITMIALFVDLFTTDAQNPVKANFAEQCWINTQNAKIVYFFVPVGLMLLFNLVMFGMIVYNMYKTGNDVAMANKERNKQLLVVYLKLFLVMGVCWIFEIISGLLPHQQKAFYFTDIVNSLQGVFIFLIYILKKDVLVFLKTTFLSCVEQIKEGHRPRIRTSTPTSPAVTVSSFMSKSAPPTPTYKVNITRDETGHVNYGMEQTFRY